jgi:putative addiction module component (TIGR02574 family)
MNKIDNAWAVLKQLPPREQEYAADAILDYAAAADGPTLSDAQAQEVERRLADPEAETITAAELRSRIAKLLP